MSKLELACRIKWLLSNGAIDRRKALNDLEGLELTEDEARAFLDNGIFPGIGGGF